MSHPRMAASAILLAGLMAAGAALADEHEPAPAGFGAAVAAEARHIVENAASVAHKMAYTKPVDLEASGYEHQGKRYRSLSAVARAITGTQWSGPLFGLRKTGSGG